MRRLRKHLSYANVTATFALIAAIGGGTTAIALQGRNSVQSNDIKNGHVTGRDLSSTRIFVKTFPLVGANDVNGTTVFCRRGFRLVSGGGSVPGSLQQSHPVLDGGWSVVGSNNNGPPTQGLAYAFCIRKKPGKPRLLP